MKSKAVGFCLLPYVRYLATMSQFRAKKLDLGCFINARIIRDHTKRSAMLYIANEILD